MTKLIASVTLVAVILLIVGQGQLLRETEAQDKCEHYTLDDSGKGGMLKDCGGGMGYVLPSGDECDLNQDAIEVFDCINEIDCDVVNVHRPNEVSSNYSTVVLLSCT